MKKLIAILLMLTTLLGCFVACGSTEKPDDNQDAINPDAGITVASRFTVNIGQTVKLSITFVPEKEGDSTALTLTSSDESVLTCNSETFELTGVADGKATVTIKNADGKFTKTVEVKVSDPVKGKTALFVGDSITAAGADDFKGWAKRVEEYCGVIGTNNGRDGTSISTCRVDGAGRVLDLLSNNKGKKYEFVILHGGTNDGWDSAPVGQISSSTNPDDFDTSTFAGGLEELFYYAKQWFPNAKLGYIINFKLNSSIGRMSDMSEYYTVAKNICKKWGIPYLDLYFNDAISNLLQYKTNKYLPDGIHPNTDGYKLLTPHVGEFIKRLAQGLTVEELK